jgi:lysophospholipase L1-like esterase
VAPAPVLRLVSASDLKRQRGWTETLVTVLLGAPDAHGPNPHGFRAPMRFYREDRVRSAESEAPFARRTAQLTGAQAWRREQPTRSLAPTEIEHLEWLDDPWRLALFHAPKRPRRLRRRRPTVAPPSAPTPRFEVLTLF